MEGKILKTIEIHALLSKNYQKFDITIIKKKNVWIHEF